jgi:hypothetical protein
MTEKKWITLIEATATIAVVLIPEIVKLIRKKA